MIARVVLTAAQVVMVTAALKAIAVSGPVITPIFFGVKISVWLSFPEFKVFSVIQQSEQGLPLFPCIVSEKWEVFIGHVKSGRRCSPSTPLVVGKLIVGC